MKSGTSFIRRFVPLAVAGVLVVVMAACTGRGGGYLPPGPTQSDVFPSTEFSGPASFGFTFSCEDKGGVNPPTGQLRIQLAYTDHGTSPLAGSPFSIHGTVDTINPVLESQVCSGQNPPFPPPEPAHLPGPLPADVGGAGRLGSLPDEGDGYISVVPLRGHSAGQRPGLRPVAG